MMRLRRLAAVAASLLAIGHIGLGFTAFDTFDFPMLWFVGSGVAMLGTAIANLGDTPRKLLVVQNTMVVTFIVLLAAVSPQPQVLAGLALFSTLLLLSLRTEAPLTLP